MTTYGFHPEALLEYAEASQYYLREGPLGVAEAFVTAVESAVDGILAAPTRWRTVEEPAIRRYVFRRFPFVLYLSRVLGLASLRIPLICLVAWQQGGPDRRWSRTCMTRSSFTLRGCGWRANRFQRRVPMLRSN